VSLNAVSSNPAYIVVVLKCAIDRLPSLLQEASICDLAEALGALHEGANVLTTASTKNSTEAELNEEESPIVDAASVILSMSRDLLSQLANAMTNRVGELTTVKLRRMLHVYAVYRLRADELVEAIEAEVEQRREHLVSVLHPETARITLGDALLHVVANAAFIKKSLIGGGEEEEERGSFAAPFKTLRKGLQYVFGCAKPQKTPPSQSSSKGPHKRDTDGDHNQQSAAENAPNISKDDDSLLVESEENRHEQDTRLREEIEQSLEALEEALFMAQDLAAAKNNNHDERAIVQDLFELGRCDELIANYYRHCESEESTGLDNSSQGRRRDMAKRAMSQLLP
jgi:hypothetical protein